MDGLYARRSGVATFERIPVDALPVNFGGEARTFTEKIDDFGPLDPATKKQIRKGLKVMCREIKMGVAAAQHALVDSGLDLAAIPPERVGVFFGTDYIATLPDEFVEPVRSCVADNEFDFDKWPANGLPKVTPLWLLTYLPNMPACHVAIYNDLRGPSNSITMREASSNLAVAEATTTIARGTADVAVTGATGCRIHPLRSVHTAIQDRLAIGVDDPTEACRPFDANRQGTVLGEGAAVVILEELEHAQKRGANILGEILGHGSSSVMNHDFEAQPDIAIENALNQAIRCSQLSPASIGHVHAHGIGTVESDRAEAKAIHNAFKETNPDIPVVAAKGNLGNLGAASGLVELIGSLHAIQNEKLFVARNLDSLDENCPINVVSDDCTAPGANMVNVSVTPQGQASCILAGGFPA